MAVGDTAAGTGGQSAYILNSARDGRLCATTSEKSAIFERVMRKWLLDISSVTWKHPCAKK